VARRKGRATKTKASSEGLLEKFISLSPFAGGEREHSFGGQATGRHVMADLFGVTSYDFEGGRIFVLTGELDAATCQGLAELLVGPPGSLVVVDLDQLTFMDSSGLGAIHVARGMAIKSGGTLVLCRPRPIVSRVLEITGLDSWVADWDPEWSGGTAVRCAP
jgi:anti-anti-sigma factor